MPYSKEHKAATRQTILNSAVALFSRYGYNEISIDRLMQHAGLTRGAFYAHFKNKKAVYSTAIIAGARNSQAMDEKPDNLSDEEWTVTLLSNYLSKEHVNKEISPCPLAFLVTDIANSEDEIQAVYTRIFKLLNKTIQTRLKDNPNCTPDKTLATTAMMIGGVAIGRALNNETLTTKLLESCQQSALEILQLNENKLTKKK